jgi:hypothetical protein
MTTATTTAVTGVAGRFTVGATSVARTTKWSVNPKLASKSEWGDSDTGGYTARTPGRKDATYSAEGKFDSTSEQWDLFQPGDKAACVLFMNTTLYWDFPCAMNDDFSLVVDVDTQEVIGWTSAWGADGIFYYPGQSGAGSRTYPS